MIFVNLPELWRQMVKDRQDLPLLITRFKLFLSFFMYSWKHRVKFILKHPIARVVCEGT
jgi:hypothetical protein